MKKSNKVLVILIVLIILLLGVGGTGAYAYFATDLLKSDKELFFKYLSQLNDEENPFIDSNITKFKEKKQDNAFTNQGSLTVNAQFPSGNDENLEKISNNPAELIYFLQNLYFLPLTNSSNSSNSSRVKNFAIKNKSPISSRRAIGYSP